MHCCWAFYLCILACSCFFFFLLKTSLDKNKTTFFLTIKFNTSTIHCQRTCHKTAFSNQNLVALTDCIDFLQCLGVRRPVLKQVGSCARARELFLWSLLFFIPTSFIFPLCTILSFLNFRFIFQKGRYRIFDVFIDRPPPRLWWIHQTNEFLALFNN